jgi:hypothetical protein
MAKIKSPGLTLLLFLWVGLMCAQENGDSSQTPVNLRSFQLILPRDHLFGGWYDVRSRLEEQGFIPTLSFVTDIAGNPIGGRDQHVTHADNLDLDLLFDMDELVDLKGGSFLVSLEKCKLCTKLYKELRKTTRPAIILIFSEYQRWRR